MESSCVEVRRIEAKGMEENGIETSRDDERGIALFFPVITTKSLTELRHF